MLATTTPEGGFTDFDPVASLPWAMAIGRAWASDGYPRVRARDGRVHPYR